MHATFVSGTDLAYSYSLDFGVSWQPGMQVNANFGTVVDAMRSTDVTYAGGVRVGWQDTRNGNNDVYYTRFSGWAFYIFDKNPRQGTIDIDTNPTAVAVAFLWATA